MHSPRPYGLMTVGGELSQDDSASVELLARRLTNLKILSGVESLRMVRTLPSGGYALAQNMGGVFRIITHKPEPEQQTQPFDGLAKNYVPMLYSGVITKSLLREDEGLGMKLSEQTRRRINNYDPNKLPEKNVKLLRFRIGYNSLVSEFKPLEETETFHTQYAKQRPTWYSGAMAEVMQIVGGYGRQDLDSLPDEPIERARMLLPEEVLKAINMELGNTRLPAYTGLPSREGQFEYDYKFNNTHGVGFDDKNKPWLIRIDTRGVWVMPFPLIPATTTKAFRQYMEEVDDQEIIAILDRFGGMPSGESFPKSDVFQAWERAGVVIKVCEVEDFYSHMAYSSTCGWSFNTSGSEGYNTCHDYYDEDGLGYGLAFKLKLKLGHVDNSGSLPATELNADPVTVAMLNSYLSQLFSLLPDTVPKNLAIKYKIRRSNVEKLLERAGGSQKVGQAEVNYWDNLELEPIATHAGSVAEVGRGYLYDGAEAKFQPQIKFPEPFAGGCVSYDFLPLEKGRSKSSYPNSDTIMYGYYIGDGLRVIKFFRDGRGYFRDVESDFEECMNVGSWTQVVTVGDSNINGNFYTSEIDQRGAFPPTVTTTTIVGKDKGYDSKPFFSFDAFFARPGSLWRNRYFTHKINTERTDGRRLSIGLCIPFFCRNAVLHAARTRTSGSLKTEILQLYSVQDPTTYRYWTHDHIFAYRGGLEVMSGIPAPIDGSPVWVEMENYKPTSCSDFADQGSWISGLPADYTWLIHPNRHEWNHQGGGGPPKVKRYITSQAGPATETGKLMISIMDQVGEVHIKTPHPNYLLASPDDFGTVFYRDACKVVFGESEYANVYEAGDGSSRKYWGYSNLVEHQSAYHFIGVINE